MAELKRLTHSRLTLSEPEQDVRGARVFESGGRDMGEVDELLVDEAEGKVKMLEIAAGGFLGLGGKTPSSAG